MLGGPLLQNERPWTVTWGRCTSFPSLHITSVLFWSDCMSKWWKKGTGRLYMKLVRLPLMATLVWLLYSCVFCSVHCFVQRPLVKCVVGLKRTHFLLINVTPVSLVRRSPTTPLDRSPSSTTPNRRETLQSILFFPTRLHPSHSLSLCLSFSDCCMSGGGSHWKVQPNVI